jgi:Cellulase (glycosyl hydrolase family 5)
VRMTGSGRAARLLSWRGVIAGSALTLATVAAAAGAAGAPAAKAATTAPRDTTPCTSAVGPFSVHGTQVLGQGGQVFVSYGITIADLQAPNWRSFQNLDLAMITATAQSWCANTVRLQLSQDNLLGPNGTSFNRAYLTAIETEVSLAESDNLVVVLNDNTEFAPTATWPFQHGPTPATKTFWKYLAGLYGNDPQVIFDLFNEPRTFVTGMSQAQEWHIWLDGGTLGGISYFGMENLAQYVRNTLGASNLFWIQGPFYSYSLAGMVSNGAVLKVSNVVYSVHHPAGAQTRSAWQSDFGYLVTDGVAPVVVGEWSDYEPTPTPKPTWQRSSCWPGAPTKVPEFLQYLQEHGIGLSAYQLQPGFLIKSEGDLSDPTTINPQTWSCLSQAEPQPGQGAGTLVMDWFWQHNS